MNDLPPTSNASSESARIELAPGAYVLGDLLRVQYARSSGPGGQNVNKVNTKAELWIGLFDIIGLSPGAANRLRRIAGKRLTRDGHIHLVAQTERSQERNRQAVMDRLGLMIQEAMIEPKPRRATKPSRAAKRRRLDAKRRRGNVKSLRGGKLED